jgi:transformation/transcription domain-associated protein
MNSVCFHQPYDRLTIPGKHEQNVDLQLEASWRITDWNAERDALESAVSIASERGTPRTKMYEAFLVLSRLQESAEKMGDLQRLCEEGIQSSLRAWFALPPMVSHAHIPVRLRISAPD